MWTSGSEVRPLTSTREAVFAHDIVRSDVLRDALVRIGVHVADNGITGDGTYGAARALLLREPPRLGSDPVRQSGGDTAGCCATHLLQEFVWCPAHPGTARCWQDLYRRQDDRGVGA